MFKKIGFPMLAIALALAFSAFTAPKKAATSQAKTVDLYWYIVDLSTDQIPQGANFVEHGSKEDTEVEYSELCPEGTQRDCMRGFTNQLDTSNGPVSAAGDDQIKTNREP